MASQEPQYSSEFKAKVALEALAQNKTNLDRLSDKYDVPVSVILTWCVQLERNASNVYSATTEPEDISSPAEDNLVVDVEIEDEEVSQSVSYGVMGDKLDYKKLMFWSVLGIIFVVIFVQLLKEMHEISKQVNEDRIAANSSFYDIKEQQQENMKRISTFGVVDLEKGIYRIPVDTVIKQMTVDVE